MVVDYKTGRARDQEDADESLQLSLYAIAAKEKWGYEVSGLAFHNLEGNVAVTTRRSADELTETRRRVQKAADSIAGGVFDAKTGIHCNFCGYRSICPDREKRISRRTDVGDKGGTR
jgi:CRISPR/Cas system-associated exonuclease Cas4 (RecB family)